MAFTIPDRGEGDNDLQSILFQEDLDILAAGMSGIDCVLSGLAVTGGADMTPAVAKGSVLSNRTMFAVAAADVTIGTADATNPRIDLIVVNSSGALAVRAGTAAAAPKPPARTANDVVIAMVYVPANDTAIATTQIIDKRVFANFPAVIFRQTTARAVNSTASAFSAFSSAPSIPDGLFLAGRILRVRMGGNFLSNSGTPTITLAISYGATTMFADVTAASAGTDTDRHPWFLEFEIVAQANNDQAMWGKYMISNAQINAPTNGIGELGVDESTAWAAIGGSAAVDSDAANITLDVQFTHSVNNAAVETVIEGVTIELL